MPKFENWHLMQVFYDALLLEPVMKNLLTKGLPKGLLSANGYWTFSK